MKLNSFAGIRKSSPARDRWESLFHSLSRVSDSRQFQIIDASVLDVFREFHPVYGRQQVALRGHNVPGIHEIDIRVGEAESLHDVIVFMKQLFFSFCRTILRV
jgi:hypothetical protein